MALTLSSSNDPTSLNQNEMVQVPASLLQSLLDSVEGLRLEVSKLRVQTKSLEDSAGGFLRFPQLPSEIRQMIWRMALTAPQIHTLGKGYCSKSKVNDVMQACVEARDECLKLKLPFFKATKLPSPEKAWAMSCPKNYVNWEVDTLWTPDGDAFLRDSGTDLYCSCCVHAPGAYYAGQPKSFLWHCENFTLSRGNVAIGIDRWEDPQETIGNWLIESGSLRQLWYYGDVRHVYIVVNPAKVHGRDMKFIDPILPPGIKNTLDDGTTCIGDGYWEDMAKEKVRMMEAYQKLQCEWRKNNKSQLFTS